MKVEQTLWTLRTTWSTPTGTFWSLYLRTLCYEIDSMLSSKSLNIRYRCLIYHSCLRSISWDIKNSYLITLPRIIEKNMNLECPMSTSGKVEIKHSSIALLDTSKWLQSLCGCCETSKAEVFETYYATILDACKLHRVLPDIVVILHPLVAVRTIHETCDTG